MASKETLIAKLKKSNNISDSVLNAISSVQRQEFVIFDYAHLAWEDKALPIECSQSISQPYTVAYMTTLANISKGDKVLEIGTGSGYQSAVLSQLGAQVYSIEQIEYLHLKADLLLKRMGYDVKCLLGDGTLGLEEFAPYDAVIITAGAPAVPQSIRFQLKIGGRLIVPVGDRESQKMILIIRTSKYNFEEFQKDSFKFVPLIGKEGWKK